MRADCADKNDGVFRMAERAASGEIVGCGTGRSGNTDAVCLNGSEMLIITKYFDGGHRLDV